MKQEACLGQVGVDVCAEYNTSFTKAVEWPSGPLFGPLRPEHNSAGGQ